MRSTNRFRFLAAFGLAVFIFAQTTNLCAADPKSPNIVFIFSDDHAYQAVSAYGYDLNQTPNIDRLAKEGMRFDRCLVPNSICGPSRATVLTGKYSHLNGFYNNTNNRFDGSQTTMPKTVKKKRRAQEAGWKRVMTRKPQKIGPTAQVGCNGKTCSIQGWVQGSLAGILADAASD